MPSRNNVPESEALKRWIEVPPFEQGSMLGRLARLSTEEPDIAEAARAAIELLSGLAYRGRNR